MTHETRRTLEGIGPKIETRTRTRERARYDWFVDQVRARGARRDVLELVDTLDVEPRLPGQVELALVELSIHPNPVTRSILAMWRAPSDELDALRRLCILATE